MRKLFFSLSLGLVLLPLVAQGQPGPSQFKVVCDTLTARCNRHFIVKSAVSLEKVSLDNGALDLLFNRSLADYPWHEEDVLWFMSELNTEAADVLGEYVVGSCKVPGCRLEELVTPRISNDGKSRQYVYKIASKASLPVVRRRDARYISKGLSGRHIVLWQSHGRYFNEKEGQWKWQRATLHRTVEDMYTQSYVLEGVIPMLENAGAYVMTPRERDIQTNEVICDNDPSFDREAAGEGLRICGSYSEQGRWLTAPEPGFADAKEAYDINDNPFLMGTVRVVQCGVSPSCIARWTPDIPYRGEYAVYVSYLSRKNSCSDARYTVHHLGGDTRFSVDQRKGGGTWIYLGTFEFAPGKGGWVELDNKGARGEVVSADAVRFGGGMGKVARGGSVSGMPAFAEGASYWMPWAGADSTLRQWSSDYTNDYATRGVWTQMMMDKGIPFDCSLAFHSDAGATPNDSIVGTLAIYTLKGDKGMRFRDGSDRMTSRTYADFVQTQVVGDLRAGFDPKWSRRMLWDRSYSESRTTEVPALLLELLSHQNFADMKYGQDPSFRFTVSRAVYKGILKYLACRYGTSYVVQPLPVHGFSAVLAGKDAVHLRWKPTDDPLEPTAVTRGYTLYTRIDDGAFDEGVPVLEPDVVLQLKPGHLYTWKVEAWNDGGCSFPSELLSAGIPDAVSGSPVLVVNNFDRVAAPAWIDTPEYAGFESRLDWGMPYVRDISFIGENYEFRRSQPWTSDDGPGFGGSYTDYAGSVVAGNTFDYPSRHGESLMRLGRPFCSMSSEAFCADTTLAGSGFACVDLICGAQLTTKSGRGAYPERFSVFPSRLRAALCTWSMKGGNMLVSGARIATDVWDAVYDFVPDSLNMVAGKAFVKDVLGYSWASSHGTNLGLVGGMPFYDRVNPDFYAVPHTDGIKPASSKASVIMRYDGSGIPAAVRYNPGNYKAVSFGVPLECLKRSEDRDRLLGEVLEYFK